MKLQSKSAILALALFLGFFSVQMRAYASPDSASLFIRPTEGGFVAGGTFEVGIYLNTGGNNVNAVRVDLEFPPDKLQVVSPNIGKSVVQFWVIQPTFSNSRGTISFQGGVPPPGINTTDGLISTVVFRVTNTGQAALRIKDSSRVYFADGKGTDILGSVSHAIFSLKLPPPQGPLVVAPKHPDQNSWYKEDDVEFVWELPLGATAVSYVLNVEPLDISDDIPESLKKSIVYKDLTSGTQYFHIKAFNPDSGWGGTTHYVVNIDDDPPADFKMEVSPRPRTTVNKPTLIFVTTDAHSGLSHFLLKVVSLNKPVGEAAKGSTPFFIEVSSPFVLPELDFGNYDVVVRAYDLAGNYREVHQKLIIVAGFFKNLGPDGLNLRGNATLSWQVVYVLLALLIWLLLYVAHFAYRRHREVERKLAFGILNLVEHRVSDRLKVLQQKREEFEKNKLKPPQL